MAPPARDAGVLVRRLGHDRDRLKTFVQLFLAGAVLAEDDVSAALDPLTVTQLESARIIGRTPDGLRATIRIGWCDEVPVVSDWQDRRPISANHVTGIGGSSLTLSDLTVRHRDVDALDIGTGGGVQAMLASGHARRVVGTDVNPRALRLASISAALNGAGNLEWRRGSFFQPVHGEHFDLVTVNPPFVISPDHTYVFRDGGETGDAVSRQAVTGAASSLRPGGWATVLCNWIPTASTPDDWATSVRAWLAGANCDAWILRYRSDDPVSYAATWLGQIETRSPRHFDAAMDRWLAYDRELGIETIVTGAVILRRRHQPGATVWADDMPQGPSGPAGEQIDRVFEARCDLAHIDDERMWDQVLVPLPGTTVDQTLRRQPDSYSAAPAHIRLEPGMGIAVPVNVAALPVVLALDGKHSLRQLSTGEENRDEVVTVARSLVANGIVGWRR